LSFHLSKKFKKKKKKKKKTHTHTLKKPMTQLLVAMPKKQGFYGETFMISAMQAQRSKRRSTRNGLK
jgi:hypothetical protein